MTEPTTTALALLRDAENYLSALHGSVARHDNLAANLACAGCELRDRIGDALPALAATPLPSAVPSAETPREQLLTAIDGTRVPPLGYAGKEELLAAYDASRTSTVDQATPSLRAGLLDEIVNALGQLSTVPPVAHRREQADQVLAVLYREWPWLRAEAEESAPAPGLAAAQAVTRAIHAKTPPSGRSDDYRLGWEEGLDAAIDAARAVLPATTRHDTDDVAARTLASLEKVTERARRAETEVKRLRAERDQLAADYAEERAERKVIQGKAARTRAELRRRADETAATETQAAEDPARIDRLRPEFFEHASVEAIDAHIQRARRQQRNWGNRERTLAALRQNRVEQKERGEWPAGARQDGAQR